MLVIIVIAVNVNWWFFFLFKQQSKTRGEKEKHLYISGAESRKRVPLSAWKTTKNHSVKNLICHILEGKLSSDLCFEENSAALLSLLILRVEWRVSPTIWVWGTEGRFESETITTWEKCSRGRRNRHSRAQTERPRNESENTNQWAR